MILTNEQEVKSVGLVSPNTLVHGDCLEVMKYIPDGSVDMVLCDLPYGWLGTTSCKWDSVIPFEPLWEQYRRITKKGAAIVLTASQPFTSALIMSNIKQFKFSWVWDKKFAGNFALSKYQPQKVHEDVVVFSYGTAKFYPQKVLRDTPIKHGANKCKSESSSIAHAKVEYENKVYHEKNPESLIHISNRSEPRGIHPTQKPVALMEYLIKTYTNEGEIVLDNTFGSCTTGVACVNLNRKFLGIEMDENYYNIGKDRVLRAILDKSKS